MMVVSRGDVLLAIAECDRLGQAEFLSKYGYGKSLKYVLVHGTREYASKAILGVAAGLFASDFSGGAAHAVRVLRKLGFKIIEKLSQVAKKFLTVIPLIVWPFTPVPVLADGLPLDPAAVFFSGVNHAGEVDGLHAIGMDIGVAADNFPGSLGDALLERLPGTDIQLFIDSGAFSEVDRKDVFKIVKPITDDMWKARFDIYASMVDQMHDQVHVVAPDQIANQQVTLDRMAKWAPVMQELKGEGARVLAPVQKGPMTQAQFYKAACEALGFTPVPAMPCMKAATTPDELRAFCEEIQPSHIHLLGIGATNRHIRSYFQAIADPCPDCLVQIDSARFPAHTGTGKNKDGYMRRITEALRIFEPHSSDVREKKAMTIIATFGYGSFWS